MPIKVRIRPELVVEVLDPTAIAAFNMDWGRDAEGNAGMIQFPFEVQVQNAVMMTIAQALEHLGPKRGFKYCGNGFTALTEVDERE